MDFPYGTIVRDRDDDIDIVYLILAPHPTTVLRATWYSVLVLSTANGFVDGGVGEISFVHSDWLTERAVVVTP